MLILGATLFLMGPPIAGWFVVKRAWPEASNDLRIALGNAVGLAIVGTAYFLGLLLFDSSRLALLAGESALLCAIGASLCGLSRGRAEDWPKDRKLIASAPAKHDESHPPISSSAIKVGLDSRFFSPGVRAFALIAVLTLAMAEFLFALDSLRHGGWDALVMWNLRARFIAESNSPMRAIFDRSFLGFHPDYPLFLPSLVSRGWQYARSATPAVPMALASLFTMTTIFITFSGLRIVSRRPQVCLTTVLLLATPGLLTLGASQYADVVIGCFITATLAIYTIHDFNDKSPRAGLPFLAGLTAATAACTKNEGILFLVLLTAARVILAFLRRPALGSRLELLAFTSGASLGVITLCIFKLAYSPVNDTLQLAANQTIFSRLIDPNLHLQALNGIRNSLNFGQWRLNPLPLMAIYAAITWTPARHSKWIGPSFTAAFVIAGLFCAYYLVYIVSPYDLESHVVSSLDRLLLQLWPAMLILYSAIVGPRMPEKPQRLGIGRIVLSAVAAALITIAVWPEEDKPSSVADRIKPHIELSRAEVTAGDTYEMKIVGMRGSQVYISYSVDDNHMGQFGAYLGTDGCVAFQVSPSTPKGIYRFLAVKAADETLWIKFENDASITVK